MSKGLITFKFFALTTEFIPRNHQIIFYVKLILADGTKDSKESKAVCISPNDIHPNGQVQADFDCTIESLDSSKNYTSFVITKSEGLAGGLPSDPTLLDPVLTEKAIEDGKLTDYGDEENKNKVPTMFNSESINGEDCSKEGKFKIIGSLAGEIEKDFEFKIELTFPYNNFADCSISKDKPSEIDCIIANEFKDESIMFEQHTIFDGLNEFLTLTNITSEELSCSKGELPLNPEYSDELTPLNPNDTSHGEEPVNEEDIESRMNSSISFRQVLGFKRETDQIKFQFFGFSTEKLEKGHILYLYLNLLLQGGKPNKDESKAKCVLKNDVDPEKGKYQADFDCSITEFDKTLVFTSFELVPKGGIGGFPDNKIYIITPQAQISHFSLYFLFKISGAI